MIFVIDSCDAERMNDAREELHGILSSPAMSNIPVVILANKQDLPSTSKTSRKKSFYFLSLLTAAMKPADIIEKLNMNSLRGKHKWFIQATCATTGDGLIEGMLEMNNLIKQRRKQSNY